MDLKDIRELLRLVNSLDLTEVEIAEGEFKLRIVRKSPETQMVISTQMMQQPQQIAAPIPIAQVPNTPTAIEAPVAPASNLHTFRSPMIGTYYSASTPNDPPFAKVGDIVVKGQKLCIVEAMKLFNDIDCDVNGKIVKVLLDNASPVEYDQALFLIEKS